MAASRYDSRESDERETPDDFYAILDDVLHFTVDLAASRDRHKHKVYFTKENSAFTHIWYGRGFLNAPWSYLMPWMRYSSQQAAGPHEPLICAVLPRRREARWYRDWCCTITIEGQVQNVQTLLVPRLKFVGFDKVTKFDLMIVLWNATYQQSKALRDALGISKVGWSMEWYRRANPEGFRRHHRRMAAESRERKLARERNRSGDD